MRGGKVLAVSEFQNEGSASTGTMNIEILEAFK
jgi:hypothetical protein